MDPNLPDVVMRFSMCTDVHKDIMPDADARLRTFVDAATTNDLDFIIQLGIFVSLGITIVDSLMSGISMMARRITFLVIMIWMVGLPVSKPWRTLEWRTVTIPLIAMVSISLSWMEMIGLLSIPQAIHALLPMINWSG